MFSAPNRLKVIIAILLYLPLSLLAIERNGDITRNETWLLSDSPVRVNGQIYIENGVTLTIKPGVQVKFTDGSGLIIEGKMIAVGSKSDSIRFTSDGKTDPGSWGGLHFKNTKTEEDTLCSDTSSAESTLRYCIIEYAGNSLFESGSAIEITNSRPWIENCKIVFSQGEAGTIKCGSKACPKIRNCAIENNSARRGGAISVGLGAFPSIEGNTIAYNKSEDAGGAIYVSLASVRIESNRFLGNEAGNHGGAIYIGISPDTRIINNYFVGNKSAQGSNVLYLTANFTAEIRDNVFDSHGIHGMAVYLQNCTQDVYASDNYWGDPNHFSFTNIIRDRKVDVAEPFLFYEPFCWAPPIEQPCNPDSITSIILCRSDFTHEIPRGVAQGAPLRIRLTGDDTNPYFADIIRVTIESAQDPSGIAVALRETTPNSGIFVGQAVVSEFSDQSDFAIGDKEGGEVRIFAPFASDIQAVYKTMSPKPLAENVAVRFVGGEDITHLIDHNPVVTWGYFDVIEAPQVSYQFKYFDAPDGIKSGDPIWDTGEVKSGSQEIKYMGPALQDGESYIAQIKVWNERLWSDPVELPMRFNSLPTAPELLRPKENELVPTLRPQLAVAPSLDREGDSLSYRFEIYAHHGVQPGEGEIVWSPSDSLVENEGYKFRAKAIDPLEEGPWSDYRNFYINATEEPPNPFNLTSPVERAAIYDLHPLLKWTKAIDPDPLSSVTYTVEIDKTNAFKTVISYSGLVDTAFTVPDSLDNMTEYYWRITATDNTDRKTVSNKVEDFYVDTTPSIPVANSPLAGEERMPQNELVWDASTDPNPDDMIFYEIEIYDTPELKKVAASLTGWMNTTLPVMKLNGWESLVDNHVYSWRVRSRDNHNAVSAFSSVGSFFYNRYNDDPLQVEAFTSPTDTVMGTKQIRFAWKESSDPDLSDPASTLIYDLECSLGEFNEQDIRRFSSNPGITELNASLDDNKLWHYRIRARDDENAGSPWSAVDSVLVNFAEDSPAPFSLIHPKPDSLVVELDSLILAWLSSSDPDWESSIRYKLTITGGDKPPFTVQTSESWFNYTGGLTNESSYTWTVTAIDNTGLETVVEHPFGFRTSTTPTAPSPAPMPEELMPDDQLAFLGATDPNPKDKLTYTVELSSDREFKPILVHVEQLPHSPGTMTAVIKSLKDQEKLEDDVDYWFRIRATDNHGYIGAFSEPVQFRFNRINDAPEAPNAPFEPIDSLVVRDRNPLFKWKAASDEDLTDPPEKLVYDIRLDKDGELEKNAAYEYTTNEGITSIMVPNPLQDNTLWVWQVRTRDDDGAASGWSKVFPVLINVAEDPPTVPELKAPKMDQNFNILGPIVFEWAPCQDVDYMSSITYRLEYGTASDLAGAKIIDDLEVLTFTAEYPLENTTYYWRVTAIDNTGLETSSVIGRFILDTRPSIPALSAPQPKPPIEMAELLADGVLVWKKSTDPNPKDKITYTIEVSLDFGGGSELLNKPGLETTEIAVSTWAKKLQDDQTYQWRVKTTDEHGIESDWSEVSSFFYNPQNDAPGAVSGTLEPSGDAEVSSVVLGWGAATDVDISDITERLTYKVEISPDSKLKSDVQTLTTKPGETSLSPKGLTDDTRWYWRVTSVDDEGAEGTASSINGFIYNSVNDAPGAIAQLLKPDDGAEVSSIKLSWTPASDKDLTDTPDKLLYKVEFAKDAAFRDGLTSRMTNPGMATLEPADLPDNMLWFWRVRAVDNDGAEGPLSASRSFIYNRQNDAPAKVSSLSEPREGAEVKSVELKWQPTTDRDVQDIPESLTYTIELCRDKNFTSGVVKLTTEAGVTTAQPKDLTDNSVWFWRVSASDRSGTKGEVSSIGSFILNTENDAPSTFSLQQPASGSEITGAVTLKWSAASDIDPNDKITYTVMVAKDAGFTTGVRTFGNLTATEYKLPADVTAAGGQIFWKVSASDTKGAIAWGSETNSTPWSFTVKLPPTPGR